MKKIIIVSLLGAALFSAPFMFSPVNAINTPDTEKKGYINVSYTAEKEVSPDTVEVSIAVKTEDKSSMQNAVKQNKEISDKVYNYLKTFINASNGDYIKTSNYSANPNYRYKDGQRYLTEYSVSNNIIIHTKNIEKISAAIDKSISLGATNVDSLSFILSGKDNECAELLSKATAQTKKRADIVASAAGSSVSGIRSIDTSCTVNQRNGVSYYRNNLMYAAKADMAGGVVEAESGAQIEAGVIKVYSTVNASYYLK